MRKFFLMLAVLAIALPSCKKIEESINSLENRIDVLEQSVPTIEEQISAIQTSIEALEEVDESLDESIKALEANDEATAEEIAALQDSDAAIEAKIEELKKYVDDAIKSTKDWVSATFATLEQLNALSSEVAALKSLVDANKAEAAANLANAIANLETSLKAWVGEQLSNYYTIVEIDAKIAALEKALADGNAALQQQLNDLKTQLESAKKELTEAYKKAIEEAITENNGVINTKIANEIAAVNKHIDEEVAAINAKITTLQAQVDKNTADIAKLLVRIQSVSYIPTYSDGKATMKYADNISRLTLDFEISPKDAVAELAKVWQDALTIKAIYTETRAVEFIEMPITKFVADTDNGIITITASGENLSEDFFSGSQSASVRLSISDGNNSVTSEYITMMAKAVSSEELGIIPSNQIWYTSSDGNIVTPNNADAFGVNIISNTYDNSKGIIQFDGDVTFIGYEAFRDCSLLASISIPDSATTIEEYAFYGCPSLSAFQGKYASLDNRCLVIEGTMYSFAPEGLTEYVIPSGIISIGPSSCEKCTNLTNITISNDVTSIGSYAFFRCSNLTNVIIGNSVINIEHDTFKYCSNLQRVCIGNSITFIGNEAFSGCINLTSIYCEALTPPSLKDNALYGTHNDMIIYVPTESVEQYKAAANWKTYASQIVGYDFE